MHRVEVFLRKIDGIPIRIAQYNYADVDGEKESIAFEMNISKLDLAPKLDAGSFELEIPKGVKPMPVLDHRPSRAQIDRIRQEYKSLLEEKKKESDGAPSLYSLESRA